jgi:hypothetical protein
LLFVHHNHYQFEELETVSLFDSAIKGFAILLSRGYTPNILARLSVSRLVHVALETIVRIVLKTLGALLASRTYPQFSNSLFSP